MRINYTVTLIVIVLPVPAGGGGGLLDDAHDDNPTGPHNEVSNGLTGCVPVLNGPGPKKLPFNHQVGPIPFVANAPPVLGHMTFL